MISQPTVPAVEPIGNDPNARMVPQSRDADLDTYCKAVSPLSPDSEQVFTDAARPGIGVVEPARAFIDQIGPRSPTREP